jgi:hypothetical protein
MKAIMASLEHDKVKEDIREAALMARLKKDLLLGDKDVIGQQFE